MRREREEIKGMKERERGKEMRGVGRKGKEKGKNRRGEEHMGEDILSPVDKPRSVMTHFTPFLQHPSFLSSNSCHNLSLSRSLSLHMPLSTSLMLSPAEGAHVCADLQVSVCPACGQSEQWPISGGGCSSAPQWLLHPPMCR